MFHKLTSLKWKHWLSIFFLVVSIIIFKNIITPPAERKPDIQNKSAFRVCYLLNIDGMKGLGHSALLLQDASGQASVFSYNGMQYNLWECLFGKAGIGKMKQFSLSEDEIKQFLETGNLQADEYEECDNFDRAICHEITQEQYLMLSEKIRYYIDVGNEFEELYAQDKVALEEFLAHENLPRYQIYTHNCDTVARELLALVSDDMKAYNADSAFMTPGRNYRNMCKALGNDWEILRLGKDSIPEKILSDY